MRKVEAFRCRRGEAGIFTSDRQGQSRISGVVDAGTDRPPVWRATPQKENAGAQQPRCCHYSFRIVRFFKPDEADSASMLPIYHKLRVKKFVML